MIAFIHHLRTRAATGALHPPTGTGSDESIIHWICYGGALLIVGVPTAFLHSIGVNAVLIVSIISPSSIIAFGLAQLVADRIWRRRQAKLGSSAPLDKEHVEEQQLLHDVQFIRQLKLPKKIEEERIAQTHAAWQQRRARIRDG